MVTQGLTDEGCAPIGSRGRGQDGQGRSPSRGERRRQTQRFGPRTGAGATPPGPIAGEARTHASASVNGGSLGRAASNPFIMQVNCQEAPYTLICKNYTELHGFWTEIMWKHSTI